MTGVRPPAETVEVSIVIVNWHSKDHLRRCLASVASQTTVPHEVVVIDSGSFDGAEAMLRDAFPHVRYLQSDANLGFARANNAAVAVSRGKCLLFLNPDTELVGPAVDVLYAQLTSRPVPGALGARLLNADGTIQSSCVQSLPTIVNQLLDCELLRRRWPRSPLWGMAPLHDAGRDPVEVEAVSGACLMVARSAFEAVSGFGEEYFMYGEDIDLCHELRRAGLRNYYVPEAVVVHYGGSSSAQSVGPFTAVMLPEAIWRFLRKTRGDLYGLGYRAAMLASAAIRLALLAPGRLLHRRRPSREAWEASHRKWVAVVRWALYRHPLVRQYYAGEPAQRS